MWAAKLSQRNRCPVDAAEMKAHQGKGVEPQQVNTPDDDFQVIGEPLYGGKGKSSGLIYNHCDFPPLDTRTTRGDNQAQVPLQTQRLVPTSRQRLMLASTNRGSNRPTAWFLAKLKSRCATRTSNADRRYGPNKRSYPHGHNIRDWWIPSHQRITQHAPLIETPCAQMG